MAIIGNVRMAGLVVLAMLLSACSLAAPTATPTPTATSTSTITLTPSFTFTPSPPPLPTMTLTPSGTPTATPTASNTPTITPTPPPTWTPAAAAQFVGDNVTSLTVPKQVTDAIGKQWIAFINVSDANPPGTPGTPVSASSQETLYLASVDGYTRIEVAKLPASVDRHVYWSPNGAYYVYFLPEGEGAGLYLVDLRNALSQRLFNVSDLSPRGFPIEPVWSPDSQRITTDLTTAYALGIFDLNADGSGFMQIPPGSDSFDLWPSWSPDGAYLAFVSDRTQCPSWTPGAPQTCYKAGAVQPTGGNLYVVDAAGKQVRKLTDQVITAPPHWISASRIAYTVGPALWWVDLRDGSTHQVTNLTADDTTSAVRDSWSPDGMAVIYQEAGSSTQTVLRTAEGKLVGTLDKFSFPRYSFAAAWSPDGKQIAIGGHNGQCPFGLILTDPQLKVTLNPSAPDVCDPIWSPDGKYLAFAGITQANGSAGSRDGRYDLYVTDASGLGIRELTNKLGGLIRILGWVGS